MDLQGDWALRLAKAGLDSSSHGYLPCLVGLGSVRLWSDLGFFGVLRNFLRITINLAVLESKVEKKEKDLACSRGSFLESI